MSLSRVDVLLIDDSLVDLRLLMDLMTLRDVRFAVAQSGDRGYQQAIVQRPGLILLDITMPDMDGLAVCRRLKANPQTQPIPVIFLTSATELATRLEGFTVGAVDFIGKPFAAPEVLARVGVHLELAQRRIEDRPASSESPASEEGVLVVAAQKILRDAMSKPPSLEELAQRVGSNRKMLNDAFQAFCGQPVFGWLREERMRLAHEILRRDEVSVSVVSDCLGFSTPANFTKAFRERYGITPSELRGSSRRANPPPPPLIRQGRA